MIIAAPPSKKPGCIFSRRALQHLKAANKENALNANRLNEIMAACAPSVTPREPQVSIP